MINIYQHIIAMESPFLRLATKKKKTGDLLARKNREVGSELIVNICVRRDQLVAYSFSPENIAFGG